MPSMSSYVAVVGKPVGESVCIFGLTPQEVRYLQVIKVSIFLEQYISKKKLPSYHYMGGYKIVY